MEQVTQYLEQNTNRALEELCELLRIPSVSADPSCQPDMQRGAEFVHQKLTDAGLTAEIIPTAGHPIVYGEWLGKPGAPTILVYGHYDVQPVDPLDQWTTPPFEPQVRNGRLYARGATDDKGQMFTHVKSVEAWLQSVGELPINVKFVIEGEEEVGSNNLDLFLEENKQKTACDVVVVSDTSQYAADQPAITYGIRGIMACEIRLKGPAQDLHSGVFGGSVANPANMLARLLAKLVDDEGRVQIPGFYDDVIPPTDEERKRFAKLPFDESAYQQSLGVTETFGEAGYNTNERRWLRPTCDINGLLSGYTGTGPKTIVPAMAMAKISCRLVPDQNPEKVTAALQTFCQEQCPPGVTLDFQSFHGCGAIVIDTNSPFMQAAQNAIEKAFGAAPVLIREGGSIPVVATFREVLGVDTLLIGWGRNTDNLHSPNEHFHLDDFRHGTLASAYLWQEFVNH